MIEYEKMPNMPETHVRFTETLGHIRLEHFYCGPSGRFSCHLSQFLASVKFLRSCNFLSDMLFFQEIKMHHSGSNSERMF